MKPLFTFETLDSGVSARVVLPNCLDPSIREFHSVRTWMTERWARMDAAFEAYVSLHRAGLVNDNLLPLGVSDDETVRMLEEIAIRPAMVRVDAQCDPWSGIATAWQSVETICHLKVTIHSAEGPLISMGVIAPLHLPHLVDLGLHLDSKSTLHAKFNQPTELGDDEHIVAVAQEITSLLIGSAFPSRIKHNQQDFPLLFVPYDNSRDLRSWLECTRGSLNWAGDFGSKQDSNELGIVRDQSKPGRAFIFQSIEHRSPERQVCEPDLLLKVSRFPKKVDFSQQIPRSIDEVLDNFIFLDPKNCRVDKLPLVYSRFATFIPSILHHVENALLTEQLCNGILAPADMSNGSDVLAAISAPVAQEVNNYQRLEFIGDSILKMLTAIALMADHPMWHEGYLSRAKDHVVSNGRLAVSAQATGLDKYVRNESFKGKKWRPIYNSDINGIENAKKRELSTKTLADVVEALIGAAYVGGGYERVLSCLSIFLPEISWLPLQQRNLVLLEAACGQTSTTLPPNLDNLERLIGHAFECKTLILTAVTHPSHLALPGTHSSSYQRLEYLGDAILDWIISRIIFSAGDQAKNTLPPSRMTAIRAATVNASFLAFCCFSRTISINIAEVLPTKFNKPPQFNQGEKKVNMVDFLRRGPGFALTSALKATHKRFNILESVIVSALDHERIYPWAAFMALAPEKVFSDMIESVLGAVYVDSKGDFQACEKFLQLLGIIKWVESAVTRDIECRHPKERLSPLAGNRTVRYQVWKESDPEGSLDSSMGVGQVVESQELFTFGKGSYRCKLLVGDDEVCEVQGWNRVEAETAAAERGVSILQAQQALQERNETMVNQTR